MKKSFWRNLFKKKRKPKKPKTGIEIYKEPKPHKTMPDHWEPPFTPKKKLLPNTNCQNLIISDKPAEIDLGKVTATVSIMLQMSLDHSFQLFIDECLERFQNYDWGGITPNERMINERRLRVRKGSVSGVYTELTSGIQIWIESDLEVHVTRICLAEEH